MSFKTKSPTKLADPALSKLKDLASVNGEIPVVGKLVISTVIPIAPTNSAEAELKIHEAFPVARKSPSSSGLFCVKTSLFELLSYDTTTPLTV